MNISDFIQALTGNVETVMDWRVINDRDKAEPAKNIRGSLSQTYQTLVQYNQSGYGVFVCVNAMDGQGQHLTNVAAIRAHVADLDNTLSSHASYEKAAASNMPPHLAVQSSPGKFHLYWFVEPYTGNDFYTDQQRRIAQLYDGDPSIIDATRVLRVPGFYHCKNEPVLVSGWMIHQNPRYSFTQVQQFLNHVNVISNSSLRKELGDPKLAAPDLNTLVSALWMINPNELDRAEWMGVSAAFKQAGWTLANEQTLREHWDKWCNTYSENDQRENLKLWNSFSDTQVGWGRFKRLTNIGAYTLFGQKAPAFTQAPPPQTQSAKTSITDKMLDAWSKSEYFKGCYFVERIGRILTPSGRIMNETQFNGAYGGKQFTTKDYGEKLTDKAWSAALYATDWTIERVDHLRFLPDLESFSIIEDEFGRKGLNTYIPARIKAVQGDVTIWLDFMNKILPTAQDVQIFDNYIAHCIKYPGKKIPWAILLQSAEGIGKQMIGKVMKRCVGQSYVYQPKAEELVSGGGRFNAWMRNKCLIMVDEIRVGDRHDLVEALKPLITDEIVAIEGKGVDQDMEDNAANWLFFSNHKDAIPLKKNGRRYAVIFSPLDTDEAIHKAGMNKEYFDNMYDWLENRGGYEAIAYYYLNHHVRKGSLPHRAPKTSSHAEALRIGRSPVEIIIDNCIDIGERGFRGGYVSWPALIKALESSNKLRSLPAEHIIRSALADRGYRELGYYNRIISSEDITRPPLLFALDGINTVDGYEQAQICA